MMALALAVHHQKRGLVVSGLRTVFVTRILGLGSFLLTGRGTGTQIPLSSFETTKGPDVGEGTSVISRPHVQKGQFSQESAPLPVLVTGLGGKASRDATT